MKINSFFETILSAPPKSTRWSWGAVDHIAQRVYLRVWDGPESLDKAKRRILVLDRSKWKTSDTRNHGYNERVDHLKLQDSGYKLFGVLCHHSGAQDRNTGLIESFDHEQLLELGALRETPNGKVFARIVDRVPVSSLALSREELLHRDLNAIASSDPMSETTREALIQARLGQGEFRNKLLKRYKQVCAATGFGVVELLRASHIKPWAQSTDTERLDHENGILLTPSLDALFDRGFITFRKNGKVRVSAKLKDSVTDELGPIASLKVTPTTKQAEYLKFHAANIYLGDA